MLDKSRRFFAQGPKTMKKSVIRRKMTSPRKYPIDTKKAVMTTQLKISCQMSENFPLNIRKWWQKDFFQKHFFLQECFYGHIDCTFDNPAEQVRKKNKKFFAECPELISIFFWQSFSSRTSRTFLVTRSEQCSKFCQENFVRKLIIFRLGSENNEKIVFSKKIISPQFGHLDTWIAICTDIVEKFVTKFEFFPLISQKRLKTWL